MRSDNNIITSDMTGIPTPKPQNIIRILYHNGYTDTADNLTHLYELAKENDEEVNVESVWWFAKFVAYNHLDSLPIGLTPDGYIQVYIKKVFGSLTMNFLLDGTIQFAILYKENELLDKPKQHISGVVSKYRIMGYIKGFVWAR